VLVGIALALLAAVTRAEGPAVRVATPAQVAGELAALRGKVVMLNVWATWCSPCLREIPDLLAVEADLAAQGFVLLGLSVDEAVEAPRVDEFRRRYFPAFRTLVRDAPDMDAAVSVVDPAWNELVPTTYLVGRDGKLLQRIQGKKTREEFRAAAQAALEAR
jgi:thiol-disulfide isomerase/thioredoxin